MYARTRKKAVRPVHGGKNWVLSALADKPSAPSVFRTCSWTVPLVVLIALKNGRSLEGDTDEGSPGESGFAG